MAVKGRSAEQKAALAKIVSPDTLDDIEEYIQPRFPPKGLNGLSVEGSLPSLSLASRRLIVQDGHGRWREVKPNIYSKNLQNYWSPDLKGKHKSLVAAKTNRSSFSKSPNASDRSPQIPEYYNNLSMALRSNVFPGLGNNEWNSTTAKVFTELNVTPLTQRDTFFGIQTDEYGKWSAANVLHERMKKKWNDYLDTLPNLQAERIDQAAKLMTDGPAPTKGRKKSLKAHKKKQKKPSSEGPTKMIPQETVVLPSSLPTDNIFSDNNDDNFWDFYDKPFNKPT